MSLETYTMQFPAYPPAIANGNVGQNTWPQDPIYVSNGLERTATALWRFKWASYSLVDIATDATNPVRPTLVPITSTSPPLYTPNSLIINPNSGISGLAGPVETTAQTVFMIVRRDTPSGNRMLANTQDSNAGGTGWGWFNANATPNSVSFLSRGLATSVVNLSSIDQRFFVLIAVAHTTAGRTIYIRHVGSPIVTAGTYRPSTRPINIGNGFSGAFNRSCEPVSAAIYGSAFSASAMAAAGERMVAAAETLGITVY